METYKTTSGNIVVPQQTKVHLQAHPDVWNVLEEAIARIALPKKRSFLRVEVDMGRIIGATGCVEAPVVGLNDSALFAIRIGCDRPSRVIVAEKKPTQVVSIIAHPSQESHDYVLITAFVGPLAPKEPWDPKLRDDERDESFAFWSSHALVWEKGVMEPPFQSTWANILA